MRALCWAMKKSNNLQHRVNLVRKKLTSVCNTSGRDIDGVKLMAVSKTREPDEIRQAYELDYETLVKIFSRKPRLKQVNCTISKTLFGTLSVGSNQIRRMILALFSIGFTRSIVEK